MTANADAFAAVEMRWRLVRAGDVVLDPDGGPWMVQSTHDEQVGVTVWVARAAERFGHRRDPDQTVRVLVPAVEAAGVVALREQLGPVRVLDRRVG